MAKRFGRNQRRDLNKQILDYARLLRDTQGMYADVAGANQRLQTLLGKAQDQITESGKIISVKDGWPFAPASGAEAYMIPMENVSEYTDETRWDRMRQVLERRAEIVLIDHTSAQEIAHAIDRRWRMRTPVSFRAVQWVVDEIDASPTYPDYSAARIDVRDFSAMQITVRLVASVPSRTAS